MTLARLRHSAVAILLAAGWSHAPADLRREAEPNDQPSEAQPIVPPVSAGGTIDAPGDFDLFAVEMEAGQTLQADVLARGFRATQHTPGSVLSAFLGVLSADGTMILVSDQSIGEFDDPTVSYQAPSRGKYLLLVRDINATTGGSEHRYVLSIEVEPNDTASTATTLDPPVIASVDSLIFPAGDLDYYHLALSAGQSVTLDIDSAVFNPAQPPAKIVLSLFNPSGVKIAEDAYTATDPQDPYLQTIAPVDGLYAVRVREVRSFVGTTNTYYQLSVELGSQPGNDEFQTGTLVSLPRCVSGTVNPLSDRDHFRFSPAVPAVVTANLDARSGLQSLLEGTVGLWSSNGMVASDNSIPDPSLTIAVQPGSFSMSVEGGCAGAGCLPEDAYYVLYLDADEDGDGLVIPDDNCPTLTNPDQSDADLDGRGDLCDNCTQDFNPGQKDSDGDGYGDVCPCFPPSEAATDLTFAGTVTLIWTSQPVAAWNSLYRGSLDPATLTYDHACLLQGITGGTALDPVDPPFGAYRYYLVSGTSACGREGTLGFASSGQERPNPSPCP